MTIYNVCECVCVCVFENEKYGDRELVQAQLVTLINSLIGNKVNKNWEF